MSLDDLILIVFAISLHYIIEYVEYKQAENYFCPAYCAIDHCHSYQDTLRQSFYEESLEDFRLYGKSHPKLSPCPPEE